MTVPKKYANNYVPIKYMLSSYRALSDARVGIHHLEALLSKPTHLFSEWKIVWIGVCSTIRSSIDLFRVDSRSCLSIEIRQAIRNEWVEIKENQEDHQIYWRFLKKERDNIVHEYKWSAYEAWMKPDGTMQATPSVLGRLLAQSDVQPVLLMRSGDYAGMDSLDLLKEAADWAEARIFSAITRAGFDPEEKRSAYDFREMPEHTEGYSGILAMMSTMNESSVPKDD